MVVVMLNEECKTVRTKTFYILKNVILFSIVYTIVTRMLYDLNDESLMENWEVGLLGLSVFTILYIIDKDILLFRIDRVNEFFVSFFLSWFLGDLDDFLMIFINITV